MGGSRATHAERSLGGEVMMKKALKYFLSNWWMRNKGLKNARFIGLASAHILLDKVANSIFSVGNSLQRNKFAWSDFFTLLLQQREEKIKTTEETNDECSSH